MKRCLVIGGAGFIGRHVTRRLCEAGREVVVLGRRSSAGCELPTGCKYVSADYGDRATLRQFLTRGCEVIDLAYSTVPKTSFDDPVFDLMSNLPTSVGLFQEAMAMGVSRLIVVSSGGTVYGSARDLPIREDHVTTPVSPYGITKLTIDRYALMFHQTEGLPVVVVRPANAYGEQQRAGTGQGFIATAIASVLDGREIEIYGETGVVRDYIHVVDVAEGIVAALECGDDGEIYNIGSEVGTSNADVIQMIEVMAAERGIPVCKKILPRRRFDVEANILDCSKLRGKSGWASTIPLVEGIRRIWETRSSSPSIRG